MYITLTKKRIFILLCVIVSVFLILIQFFSVKADYIDVSTNQKRVAYITALGITLQNDEYSKKDTVIPLEFGNVYNKYNTMQKQSGFDLSGYKGQNVTIYTYNCDTYKVVNLIVYKGRLIGGDICDLQIDGQMLPLKGS
ncbi:MAG: DUF4830 domain-containing protein [Ruminococcaceae bacterium]|nr:DUF4830 domain-containing protein [Oscillospiraceae bacterium]